MKTNTNIKKYCKKLTYKLPHLSKPNILIGVIVSEDSLFIKFKTGKKEHLISKNLILDLVDTTEIFIDGGGGS